MSVCSEKHTKYQPLDQDWKCPSCGAGPEAFIISFSADEAADDCELVHKDDDVECSACGYKGSGEATTKRMAAKKNLVLCPCCKGVGYVKDKEKQ